MKKVNTLWSLLVVGLVMGGCGVSASNPTGNFKITTDTLPSAQISAPYTAAVQAAGGTAPYSWSIRKGNWPQGIILNSSTGSVAGSPIAKGRFSITLGATDSSTPPVTTTQTLTLTVNSTQIAVTTTSLPSGAQNVAYSATLAADNGTAPYTWKVSSGKLPSGLTLASSGTLSGTPTQTGTFSFTAEVTDSTDSTATASLSLTIAAPSSPVINSLSPSSGPTAGGSVVTISGANFVSGASVSFGGAAAASVTVSSGSQIQAVAPGHVAGTVGVIVSENGENSGSANFTYNALTPAVSSVSPSSGPTAGGTTVTISGSNFLAGALVLFGTVPATNVSIVSATQIQATTPANAAGPATVSVQDPGNLSSSLSGGFTYTASQSGSPTITSVSPSSGGPGTQVTITGTNFESADTVAFGSSAASSSFVSASQITATVPAISAGTYSITVTDPDPASATLSNSFTVTAPAPAQSLLSGCTVSASNTPNCAIPSGWSVADAQGFEGSVSEPTQGNIDSSIAHTGGKSLSTTISGDGGTVALYKQVGAVNDVYISQWRYEAQGATTGTDHYFDRLFYNNGSGTLQQECIVDWQDTSSNYISTTSTNTMECQNNGGVGVEATDWDNSLTLQTGTWVQYELWFHANTTCTGSQISGSSLASGDGFFYFYVNGTLQMSKTNVNLTNCNSFSQNPGLEAEAVMYMSAVWFNNGSGGCLANGASGAASYPLANPFSSAPAMQVDGVHPCWGSQQPFKVALDDIIIMTK